MIENIGDNKSKPVATTIEVKGFTRKGARIEIEVTAVVKK